MDSNEKWIQIQNEMLEEDELQIKLLCAHTTHTRTKLPTPHLPHRYYNHSLSHIRLFTGWLICDAIFY